MRMKSNAIGSVHPELRWTPVVLSIVAVLTGCATASDQTATGEALEPLTIQDVKQELGPGDDGPAVEAVFNHLRASGYFPNPELEAIYSQWAPVVDTLPEHTSHFGRELVDGVQAYQRHAGLEPTGVVDSETLELMQQLRCGNPVNELALEDASEKWNHLTGSKAAVFPSGGPISWAITSCKGPNGGACPAYASAGSELTAFSLWAAETNRTFQRIQPCVEPCSPSIDIKYYDSTSVPAPGWPTFAAGASTSFAGANLVGGRRVIGINTSAGIGWNANLVARVLTHELGHTLGLAHSSLGPNAVTGQPATSIIVNSSTNAAAQALMYFAGGAVAGPVCPGSNCWHLTLDDRQSIMSRCSSSTFPPTNCYSSWTQLPGIATDIGVGGSNPVGPVTWVTSGSNTVWKRTGNSFTQDPNQNGIAIAVTSGGVPWVVTTANTIRRRSDATCNPNAQSQCPGTWSAITGGSARDVAIGGSSDSTWIVSNVASGNDFSVRRWNGTAIVVPANTIQAQRITVDSNGFPWVVKADKTVFMNASTDGSVAWAQVTPGSACANDIGAGRNGGVYAIGCVPIGSNGDFDIWVFDKQVASAPIDPTDPDDASITTWRPLSGFAKRIAVGPDARPYVVQGGGAIFNLEGL